MKGLLTKDLCLMREQKKAILGIAATAILFSAVMENMMIWEMYFVFFAVTMAAGTISYDEFDNGFSYLFTLPVSRRKYVQEKYILALLMVAASLIGIGFLGAVRYILKRGDVDAEELLFEGGVVLIMGLLLMSFTLPVYLKFGVEKGRYVMMGFWLGILGVVLLPAFLVNKFGITIPEWIMRLEHFSPDRSALLFLISAGLLILAGLLAGSLTVAYRAMEKKEF